MIFKIVYVETLQILHEYQAIANLGTSDLFPIEFLEPLSIHLEVPEALDKDCVKAALVDSKIVLVEDEALIYAKQVEANKQLALEIRARCDADIEAQQVLVYGTKNQSAALATQQSWSDIESYTQEYVPMMFPTLDAATAYIAPRMQAARQFAVWRFQRISSRDDELAALSLE